ncbi:MAG: O-antigen ligase family protein [Bdellovibrio sp.]|nr:O-antigen ligase family protein [Bdellovibrio sp.]
MIFAMLAPLQDLPRITIPIINYDLRIAFLGIPLIFIGLIAKWRENLSILLKNMDVRNFCILIILFLLYCVSYNFIFTFSKRSIGFCIWLFFNIFILISSSFPQKNYLLRGLLIGQFFVGIHIILSHFFFPDIPVPAVTEDFRYQGFYLRVFSLMGEPSYVPLSMAPLILHLLLKRTPLSTFEKVTIYTLFLALGLIYARTVLVATFFIFLITIFYKRQEKKFLILYLLVPLFLSYTVSFIRFPGYYGSNLFPTPKNLIKHLRPYIRKPSSFEQIDTDKAFLLGGSNQDRLRALQNGIFLFKRYPFFGVGLANSYEVCEKECIVPERELVFSPHNIFLELLVDGGIIGFTIVSTAFFFLARFRRREGDLSHLMPMLLLMILMQLAQNINMPAIWIFSSIILRHKIKIGARDSKVEA